MKITRIALALGLSGIGLLSGCSSMNMGSQGAKTEATGSAGGSNSQNANSKLATCTKPLGTIAVQEDTSSPWYGELTGQYHLGSTVPVLKLMIQQSNCFVVVDRGLGLAAMNQERQLAQSGDLRGGSSFGQGQMVAADYTLIPSITFSNNNSGGVSGMVGMVGGLLGPLGAVVSDVGGSLKSSEASTLLTVDDNRSGVQLAAAEGSAKNWDLGVLGDAFGYSGWGSMGAYSHTAQGKVIVAAFMDSYNGIVKAVENYKAQHVQGGLGLGGHLGVQGGTTEGTGAAQASQASTPNASTQQGMSVYQAQEKLNALGFNVGRPDGNMGPMTRSALMRFQRSRGIAQTGELDTATVAQLSQ